MSTADTNFDHVHSHDDRSGERRSRYKSCKSGVWSLPNIALMVLGFILFAPLGFLILFGLIMGGERWMLRHMEFPFGHSLIAIAHG